MIRPVALRARNRLVGLVAALGEKVEAETSRREGGRKVDVRNYRTLGETVWRLLWKPTLRLKELAPQTLRKAKTVKGSAARLSYFLSKGPLATGEVLRVWGKESLARLPEGALWTHNGLALVVIDPTVYAKRSRKGKRGRSMEYVSRVRDPRTEKVCWGYEDIWGGVVLKDGEVLPLQRELFSPAHPDPVQWAENLVIDRVLEGSLRQVRGAGYDVIVVGDRGISHKERLVRLVRECTWLVMRVRGDISVEGPEGQQGILRELLVGQPPLGKAVWKEGKEKPVPGQVHLLRGKISFSRSGRKSDRQEAWLTFLALVPDEAGKEPLLLVTNLPVRGVEEAKGVFHVYERRWGIETTLETLKAWGLEKFMVRRWQAIGRLCSLLALAYCVSLLALYLAKGKKLGPLLGQIRRLLRQLSVSGRRLTVGKLREAMGLDYQYHPRSWKRLVA